MNVERLREVIDLLLSAEEKYGIESLFDQLRAHLQQLSNNPQDQTVQKAFADALERLRKDMADFRSEFTPAQIRLFEEIHATEAFVADIPTIIDLSIRDNPLTPTVTFTLVNELFAKREGYLAVLQELRERLHAIGIEAPKLEPGSAELGVLIPRELFKNHLAEFINELRTLNLVIRVFSEIATGSTEPVEIHQISTSDPVFFLGISSVTIAMVGKAVTWALDTWKKVEDIKKVRAETQKLSVFKEEEIKAIFDTKIEETIKSEVAQQIKERLPVTDGSTGRDNELRIQLSWALESILTRVERGMIVELRFLPAPRPDNASAAMSQEERSLQTLQKIAPKLVFPPADPSPTLPLPPPEPPPAI